MKTLPLLIFISFLTSCQMVPVQEMAFLQSLETSQTKSKKIFINMFDPKSDTLLYEISKADFKARYQSPHWEYLEITQITDIGPKLDERVKQVEVDELVFNAHGSPFGLMVGRQILTKRKLKKINFIGSLAANGKVFLLSCSVGQKSMFQWGTPFIKKLGKVFLKQKGTVIASTKLVVYPEEYIEALNVERKYRWYSHGLGYLLLPFMVSTYQYLTWSPWDKYRIRKIAI